MSGVLEGLTNDQRREAVAEAMRMIADEKERVEVQKLNLVDDDHVAFFVYDGAPRPVIDFTTEHSRGQRVRIPKDATMKAGDALEIAFGDRNPPPSMFRKASDDEAAKIVTLQQEFRVRESLAREKKVEEELAQKDRDIANAEGIAAVAIARKDALTKEREAVPARLEAAKQATESLFAERTAAWKKRALALAASDRTPPREEPSAARAFFPPRQDDSGKQYRWDPATMTNVLVR
jgi:hypothetical protein